MTRSVEMWESGAIDHELQEIAVRVSDVHARAVGPATAVPRHRSLFDRGAHVVEKLVERLRGSVPHEAEVAARRRRGRGAQSEPVSLPELGAVEVDHLAAGVDGDHGRKL